jgi:predicted esterase
LIAVHGDSDETVKIEWAQEQMRLLAERGINVEFHSVEGTKHEISPAVVDLIKKLTE